MRSLLLSIGITALILGSAGCSQDQPEGDKPASIVFRTDSGYTWADDTTGLADTLLIGVAVAQGSDELTSFYVDVSYNGAAPVRKDSVHITVNPFTFDKTVITQDQPGTEKWTFSVEEPDGDLTRRSLTFTTQ